MNEAPRKLVDRFMTIVITIIAFTVLGQVLTQVLFAYMVHLIIAGAVVITVWLILRAVLAKQIW